MDPRYQTFVQIVEHETLVRAAEALRLTQPTVTRQVQQLEAQVGMRLFDRIGKRLVLNRAGEIVYRYAKSCLLLEQKMRDELAAFLDPEAGTVYLGAGLTPSIYLLPPLLARYRRLHPHVQFQVRSGSSREVWAMLRQREVDLGVVTTVPADRDDLVQTPLVRDALRLVAAPGHPLTRFREVRLADAAQYPFVLMREGSSLRAIVERLVAARGATVRAAMETDSLESINRLVQQGIGIAVLPESAVQDDLLLGRLVSIPVVDADLGARTITLVARAEGSLPACAAQFARWLPAAVAGAERTKGEGEKG
ncbi:LysR family transcriptional regulator [Alicyclobacillus cellulosilyticus]|uniref:LysR family transcriptional regulator n=1 Tax=Alicyclobacillus cellulosilyticus TaxID=1003997 RepID=A0A917NMB1_9BACL|nr:LysR family transcriptional regulator [Alicyclobacillus cellulosilyticus]GGJ08647.1 LysR family transcriptional regulator [Alicyclobacillus cellulosilyticus]